MMSYNVRLFDLYNWRNETGKSTRAAIFDLINTESSDVLCLQEFYSGAGQNLDFSDSIASKTGYKYKSVELINKDSKGLPFGQAIFSKYPIIKNQKISFSNSMVNFGQISDIKIGKDTIRVINLHFESIKFGKEDYNFVSEVTSTPPPNEQIKKVSKQIIQKMKNAYIRRSVQAETVSRFVESSPYPVVLCGDFNDTPVSYSYRLIDKNLDDAFVNKGKGLGQTHAQMLPLLRLDYIFHSKSMQTLEYKTIDKDYSDHFPVVARLLLPQ